MNLKLFKTNLQNSPAKKKLSKLMLLYHIKLKAFILIILLAVSCKKERSLIPTLLDYETNMDKISNLKYFEHEIFLNVSYPKSYYIKFYTDKEEIEKLKVHYRKHFPYSYPKDSIIEGKPYLNFWEFRDTHFQNKDLFKQLDWWHPTNSGEMYGAYYDNNFNTVSYKQTWIGKSLVEISLDTVYVYTILYKEPFPDRADL